MMLRLAFDETEVNVHTTSTLSRLLAATHRRYRSSAAKDGFEKRSDYAVRVEIAPPDRTPELALREAHLAIAAEVAAHEGWYAVKAVVIERDGRALALVGAPGSGRSTIAAHLVSRGWRLVSDDIAFVDPLRSRVVGHHSLMILGSGAIPHLPASFRAILECSHWFVDEQGELQFYEVDPASVFGADAWSGEAALDAIVIVDEGIGTRGVDAVSRDEIALHAIDGRSVPLEAIVNLRVGVIRKESARRTADHVERWYDAHVGA